MCSGLIPESGGKILIVINLFFIVHGGWSDWSEWTRCSVTCGGGIKNSTRLCDNPAPAYGGNNCTGDKTKLELCNNEPCPGSYSFALFYYFYCILGVWGLYSTKIDSSIFNFSLD